MFGGLGGIMGWLAPVGGDLLSGWREKREPPLQLSDLPAAAVGQLISLSGFSSINQFFVILTRCILMRK